MGNFAYFSLFSAIKAPFSAFLTGIQSRDIAQVNFLGIAMHEMEKHAWDNNPGQWVSHAQCVQVEVSALVYLQV